MLREGVFGVGEGREGCDERSESWKGFAATRVMLVYKLRCLALTVPSMTGKKSRNPPWVMSEGEELRKGLRKGMRVLSVCALCVCSPSSSFNPPPPPPFSPVLSLIPSPIITNPVKVEV